MSDVSRAAAWVRERMGPAPELGLVLGSGLGDLADIMQDSIVLETASIPDYPASSVQGHSGRLVFGVLEGTRVVFVQGRLHMYEGHDMRAVTFPVRLLAALGVTSMVVTNAAGGVNPAYPPGTLMWITDHINWTFENPMEALLPKAPPSLRSGNPYDPDWTDAAQAVANELGIATVTGTYIWTRGPNYETPAEIRAFRKLGADAVGMSTVPEVLVAHSLGLSVLGLSTITNPAAGLNTAPLNHEEVLETGRRVKEDLTRLVLGIISARN
jgi:purine-nucleoside phosphorylase